MPLALKLSEFISYENQPSRSMSMLSAFFSWWHWHASQNRNDPVGSILEFKTSRGYHYLQYAHLSESGMPLLGVLTLKRATPVNDISEIGAISYQYFVLYHFPSALSQKLLRLVGALPIPRPYRAFPLMRVPGPSSANGKVLCWFVYKVPLTFDINRIADPSVRDKVDHLAEEQKKLSIGSIINHSLLVERVEASWCPEDET